MKILYLTLTLEWFLKILHGIKKEEYRKIKPHWISRIVGKQYDAVHFRNGYDPDAPAMLVKLNGIRQGRGNPEWGALPDEDVFILSLGEILETKNTEGIK